MHDKTQATTFSPRECPFLEAPEMYQEDILLYKNSTPFSFILKTCIFLQSK